MMKHTLCSLLVLLVLLLSACGSSIPSAVSFSSSSTSTPTQPTTSHYMAKLTQLNVTHVSGTAHFTLTGNILVITIHAIGLQPGKEHYLHIHGAPDSSVSCPTKADADANGHITIEKALTIIGPVAHDLQPYPQPDAQGAVSWSQIFHLEPYQLSDITPLSHHVIVLHGMTYQGIYDRALTVACGPIQAA